MQRAADYDKLMASATLSAVLAVERILKSEKFKQAATCVNIVGGDIVIAVHGDSSRVFSLGKQQEGEATDDCSHDARAAGGGALNSQG